MKKHIMMVDVDSTLYDADALFHKIAIDEGYDWYPRKSYEWFRADHVGVSQEVMTNLFRKAHSRKYVQTVKPYKGSVEVLNDFMDEHRDHIDLWYVSSRHPQTQGTLLEWIVDKGFWLTKENHVIATMDKKGWIHRHKPKIVIDDRVQTIIYSRFEIGAYVLSLIHNHNRNLANEVDGVWMCQDWYEIGFKLENIIMPKLTPMVKYGEKKKITA